MKLRHILEILIFYIALAVINFYFFPKLPAFMGVEPHPYWLGILLFGFRYGVWAGLLSGLISAGLYLAFAWVGVERYLFEDVSFYVLPFLFIIIGVVVGVGVYQYRLKISRLKITRKSLEEQGTALQDDVRTLREINAGLEQRIVTRMQTLVTLYQGAQSLATTDLETLYAAILNFVAKTTGANEAAIYVKEGTGWKLKTNVGWKAYQNYPAHLNQGEGITGMAAASGKIMSVRDFLTDATNHTDVLTDCMISGPIRKGETGEVVAMVSIQEIPFLSFNSATISLLSLLLDWASRAIGHAYEMSTLREGEIWDPLFRVFSHRYFQSRVEQEWMRSKTYYLPLSIGLVKIKGLDALSQSAEDKLMVIVASLLRDSCRDMDVVARYDDPNIPFAFILMTAGEQQATEIRAKIMDNFSRLALQKNPLYENISLHIGMSHFTPQTKDVAQLLVTAGELLA